MLTPWSDTLLLMLLGMGTVFTFLVVLIACLYLMSAVIQKIAPEEVDAATLEQEVAAAAAVAYSHYKKC